MLDNILKYYNYTFDEYVNSLHEIRSKDNLHVKLRIGMEGEKYVVYLNDFIPLDVEKLEKVSGLESLDALLLTVVKINPIDIELSDNCDLYVKLILTKLGYNIDKEGLQCV